MSSNGRPLIVGAGPVGLGAALFLARRDILARVVEAKLEPSATSKALAVNPRTLEILEPSGVTAEILRLGRPIVGMALHRNGRVVAEASLEGIHPKYSRMTALSQATTERLLARAAAAHGVEAERGLRMTSCANCGGEVEVTLEPTDGGEPEAMTYPWLLAADGAHSAARHAVGLDFPGEALPGEWFLADVPLKTPLAEDRAHILLGRDGEFQFRLRVVDEALDARPGDPYWRVISNRPDPLPRLEQAEVTGEPVWTSSFHIAHRIVPHMAAGRVFFAGDAAHIHSPMGARGMNLGLEDAWVFANLAARGQLDRYDSLRQPVDREVVRRVERLTKIVDGGSGLDRFLRAFVLPVVIGLPFARGPIVRTATGLDHDLPADLTPTA